MKNNGGVGATMSCCGVAFITQEPQALTSASEVVQHDD